MVYFVKLQAYFHGFRYLEKLIPEGDVFGSPYGLLLRENKSLSELKKSIRAYQNFFLKTFDDECASKVLLTGLDMLNALHCIPIKKTEKNLIQVMEGDSKSLQQLNQLEPDFIYKPYSANSQKFSLILAHGASIPDFEKLENLCQLLGKGQLYIKIETGNIAGLNQFEKLRLFFGTKKDVLVSTYPLNEESDMMLIEKKWA
ncbi:MAG: hypothetical protein ACOVP1_03395 [Bacteroidia bacterium]